MKKFLKILIPLMALLLALVVAGCNSDGKGDGEGEGEGKNTYETPVELAIAYANQKSANDMLDYRFGVDMLNGFVKKEFTAALNILRENDEIKESMEYAQESFDEHIAEMKEEYGSDYKYSYKIDSKEAISDDDLDDFKDEYKDNYKAVKDILEEFNDLSDSEWEDFAEYRSWTVDEAKEFIEALENLYGALKEAEITEGYELEVTTTLKGSNLEEPETETETVTVILIGGRWVNADMISSVFSIFSLIS